MKMRVCWGGGGGRERGEGKGEGGGKGGGGEEGGGVKREETRGKCIACGN